MCEVKNYASHITQLFEILALYVPKGMVKASFATLGQEKGKELIEGAERLGIKAEFLNDLKTIKPRKTIHSA